MKNLAFIGNSEPPHKLLEIWRKMTPGRSGCWGQLRGVGNYQEADYFGVIDYLPPELKDFESRCVFLGAHPPESHYSYRDMRNYKGIKMYDCVHTVGFLEWWLDKDYDFLTNLQPNCRNSPLCAIVSNAETQSYHHKRRAFLDRFCNPNGGLAKRQTETEEHYKKEGDRLAYNWFDLYGRIQPWGGLTRFYRGHCGNLDHRAVTDHMVGKEEVYRTHCYAIEFDAIGEHYFSERVLDCLLMWCYPIYWGGRSLANYIPKETFSYLNIDGSGEEVLEISKDSSIWSRSIPFMTEARRILLNELQLWPRIHHAIFGTYQ